MELLLLSALTIGIVHALAPDHWLPFVVLGKTQQWSGWKTTRIVSLAGLGHVGSSVIMMLIGVSVGAALEHVDGWEAVRGDYASLLLILFGVLYTVWGLFHWQRHTHHHSDHHVHDHSEKKAALISYWTLFAVIVFGPCEPLIPLLFASVTFGWMAVGAVFLLFGAVTIGMMLLQVHLAMLGLSMLRFHFLSDASHIIAGLIITVTGLIIRIFGI